MLTLNKCRNLFPHFCYWLLTCEYALRIWYRSWKNHLMFFGSSHSKEFFNIRSVINFYTKALKSFPENNFCRYCGFGFHWSNTFSRNFHNNWNKNINFHQIFKTILINDDSFLQIYCSEMNFSTHWFSKIKCSSPNPWK